MTRARTCVSSLVYLEILTASKHLATAGEGAREWLLARVHANVVDQLVFSFERAPTARTITPEARVVRVLGPAHVLHGDVAHYLVHGREGFVARLLGQCVLGIDPQANQVGVRLYRRLMAHVAKQSRTLRCRVHVVVQ